MTHALRAATLAFCAATIGGGAAAKTVTVEICDVAHPFQWSLSIAPAQLDYTYRSANDPQPTPGQRKATLTVMYDGPDGSDDYCRVEGDWPPPGDVEVEVALTFLGRSTQPGTATVIGEVAGAAYAARLPMSAADTDDTSRTGDVGTIGVGDSFDVTAIFGYESTAANQILEMVLNIVPRITSRPTRGDGTFFTSRLVDFEVVPLPATAPLLLGAVGLLAGARLRRR